MRSSRVPTSSKLVMMSSMMAPPPAHSLACWWYVSMCQSSTASFDAHMLISLYQLGSSGWVHHVRCKKPGLDIRWWRTLPKTSLNFS